MLDLGKLQQKLYKIKLLDGTILQIPKPSQLLLKKMINLEKVENKGANLLDEINNILLEIFSTNKNGIVYTFEDIEKMFDLSMALVVIKDYINFSFDMLGE
ncbi:MAG: hypothetical protein KIC92_09110 [Clostridiales bacterium]|nr:hypothetical protein [Clostridiales bacterium]